MTHQAFINKWSGKYLEYNGDQYKFQCMDLFWQYIKDVWGIQTAPFQGHGTAKKCFNAVNTSLPRFKNVIKIMNTPNNVPQKGDVVFWGFYPGVTGLAGHVAIYNGGNVWNFVSFDQNYPTRSVCHLQSHSYRGVMGWLRLR